jgi:DNA polymerase-3 subunit delta
MKPLAAIAALWQRLDQGTIDPFYLFFGQETYLAREYTETLTARILGGAPRDFNYDCYAMADRGSLVEALGTARTLPVMAPYRVVVVQDLQELRKAENTENEVSYWKLLEGYVTAPCESTVLIAVSRDSEPKKFPAFVWKHATAVACDPLKGGDLRGWVARAVGEAGYRMTDEAIRGLLQDHDPEPGRRPGRPYPGLLHETSALRILEREIEKLCTYVGEPGQVNLEDVQAVGQASRQHLLFALSDALGGRQPGPALLEVDQLLNQGEPPLVVMSMIVRHFRLLWTVKQLAGQGQDRYGIAKTLRLPSHVCRTLMEQSRTFSAGRLQELYGAALEADLTFKSTDKPPRAILEGLVLRLCAGV